MKKHSVIGASSAKRWFNCPGSVREIAKYPVPPQSEYAAEGTAAHELAEILLNGGALSKEVDQEMIDHVKMYVDTVWEDQEMLGGKIVVEEEFELHHLHPNLWGTNDAALITDVGVLVVYDFKYGKGVVVEVEDNEQLMIYALGAMKKFNPPKLQTVEIVIVQPRAYHEDGRVRRQKFDVSQLVEFAKELKKKAEETDNPKAKLKAGDWCKFCPAQVGCPALRKKIESTAMVAFDDALPSVPEPASLSPQDLAKILRIIPMIDEWVNSVKSFALEKAKRGEIVDGFKIVRGRQGNRAWGDEVETEEALKPILGDRIFETSLLSPAQMEKLLPKAQRGLINDLTTRADGKLNLVPEEDPRPALESAQTAGEVFE